MGEIAFHPFNSCDFILDRSVLTATLHCGEKVRCVTTWSVVRHPEGIVVIDTGVHDSAISDVGEAWGSADERIGMPLMRRGQEIPAQLARLGIDPADVRYVVNTHLHGDHVGGQLYFPHATFVCQQDELAYSRDPDIPSMVREYPREQIAEDTLDYQPIDGDHDLFGDGVFTLYKTPGHAPGHQSILLRLPETGPVLLAGDACWTRWNQDEMTTPSIVWFVSQYVKSRRRLLELAEREGARWFYTHDPGVFDDLGWEEGGTYR